MKRRLTIGDLAVALWVCSVCPLLAHGQAAAQRPLPPAQVASDSAQAPAAPHRTRLILKDGSYQIVMSYTLEGQHRQLPQRGARRDRGDPCQPGRLGRNAQGGSAPTPTAAQDGQPPAPVIDPSNT